MGCQQDCLVWDLSPICPEQHATKLRRCLFLCMRLHNRSSQTKLGANDEAEANKMAVR